MRREWMTGVRRPLGMLAILGMGVAIAAASAWSRAGADPSGPQPAPSSTAAEGSGHYGGMSPKELLAAHERRMARQEAELLAWLHDYLAQPRDLRELPREEYSVHGYIMGGEDSLPRAVAEASVIVAGTARAIQIEGRHANVTVTVEQTLKGRAPSSINVGMSGGPRPAQNPQGAKLEVYDGAPLLLPGDTTILFLGVSPDSPSMYYVQPYSGMYYRRDGRVYGLPATTLRTPVNGQLEQDFFAAIHRAVRKPPPPLNPPSEPEGIRAAPVSSSRIELRWKDTSANETHFELYVHGPTVGANVVKLPANTSRWVHDQLRPNTRHSYSVRACNADGCSPWTDEIDVHTAP